MDLQKRIVSWRRGSQERMMLEMEADMPLSNAQLYAEMKKEMKGAGGAVAAVEQGLCWYPLMTSWGIPKIDGL